MHLTDRVKWCHVVWHTHRQRPAFKIAATARFCERVLRDGALPDRWVLDAVAVQESGVQALVQVPATLDRDTVARELKGAAGRALVAARILPAWGRRPWDEHHWCVVLTNAAAVAAVRRHIHAKSCLGGACEVPGRPGAWAGPPARQ